MRRYFKYWVEVRRYIADLVGKTGLAVFHIGWKVVWYGCLSLEAM